MKKFIGVLLFSFVSLFTISSIQAGMLNEEPNFTNIVIFIKFADEDTYQAPYDYEHYNDMFNGVDQVSLRDYYLEATYNQLTIDSYIIRDESDQIIWYQDNHTRSYYEDYDENTNPNGVDEEGQAEREHALLKAAVDYVDDNSLVPNTIDLDRNEDGLVDSLTFMISGEDNGWNSLLWPHRWELYSYTDGYGEFLSSAPTLNGLNAYDYTFELLGNSQDYINQVDVGVLAHETFHLLSAPDLYHYYEYTEVSPVGDWGLMDGTTSTPSHMLGYMKHRYGNWIDSISSITESGSYTLYPLQDSKDNLYKIDTGIDNEYIYLEYRDNDGKYEAFLPDSGLLVYRVNSAFEGNADVENNVGGNPDDEIWIFRPYMDDEIPPIIIENTENIDGNINQAALSDTNQFDMAGGDSEIKLFSSDGSLLGISIYNVVEHDGYITFDLLLPPTITLNTKQEIPSGELILLNHPSMDYSVNVGNLPVGKDIYYTLDGSEPTVSSNELLTSSLPIDSINNTVKIAVFDGETHIQTITKTFTFSDTMESEHNPYGNMRNISWYLDFGSNKDFSITFDDRSFLEVDYDYLYLKGTDINEQYTGNDLKNITRTYSTDSLVINFVTDQYVEEGYGFSATLDVNNSANITLIGENQVTTEVFDEYTDQGIQVLGLSEDEYTVDISNEVNSDIIGSYFVTYIIKDLEGNEITTLRRTVTVVDTVNPIITLLGDETITINQETEFTDPSVTYSDNYDSTPSLSITGLPSDHETGQFTITYTVTDSSGNTSTVTRTLIIVDTTPPTSYLEPGIDTIYVGDTWEDAGVNEEDSDISSVLVDSGIDSDVPGTYIVTYTISDDSENTTVLRRVVTVLEKPLDYDITCDPFVSTLPTNSTLSVGNCYINDEEMTVDSSSVKTNSPGNYTVTYTHTINGVTYTKKQYVYIYSQSNETLAIIDERRKYL